MAGQAVGKRAEPARHPAVQRHVGHHARAADVAGLRREKEQPGLGAERQPGEPGAEIQLLHEQTVHGPALDRMQVGEQVTKHQAARRHGQRDGHVEHGPLGVRHLRLAHGRDAVGDRLDAGVGAGPAGVGLHEDDEQHPEAEVARIGVHVPGGSG